MITVLSMLYFVSWRYRVRPRSADQHAQGSLHAHEPVIVSADQWYCSSCSRTHEYRPPMSAGDRVTTIVIVIVIAVLGYLSYRVGGTVL